LIAASACAAGHPPSTAGSASALGEGSEAESGADGDAETDGASPGFDDGSSGGSSASEGGSAGSGGPAPLGPCAPGVAPAFPGAQWSMMDADAAGLDAVALDAFIDATGNASGVLVRCGHLVATWGAADEPFEWGGATRAVTSTLLMFAVQEGHIANVDAAVAPLGWALQGEDGGITLRQLANETSGYGLPESPGAAWAYNDVAGKLFALSI
jgi:CubicO group peptidase (beta-lactamase class C family)